MPASRPISTWPTSRSGWTAPALLDALAPFFKARGIEANWEAMEQTSDEMLVLTLAMVCPFEVREKQALLVAATPAERAEMLVALLRIGAHAADAGDRRRTGGQAEG